MYRNFAKSGLSLCNSFSSSQIIFVRYLPQARRRFYKNVSVSGTSDCYEISLDHRKLKTPLGKVLQVPNLATALAIANEWENCRESIVPSWMHLSSLAFTVVDNPNKLTKESMTNNLLEFLNTDTLLMCSDSPEDLVGLQMSQWKPILNWFNKKFGIDLEPSYGITGIDVPSSTLAVLQKYFLSYNLWSCSGFSYGTDVLKSLILTIAAAERQVSSQKAVYLSRLETEFQAKRWGSVEWAHDVEKFDLEARFSAALLFIHLNASDLYSKCLTKEVM